MNYAPPLEGSPSPAFAPGSFPLNNLMVGFKASAHEQRHTYNLYQAGGAGWLATALTSN